MGNQISYSVAKMHRMKEENKGREEKIEVRDKEEKDLKRWMENSKLDELQLNEIAFPGTHQSGMIGGFEVSKCQDLTFKQQLELGARWFDIRAGKATRSFQVWMAKPFFCFFLEK